MIKVSHEVPISLLDQSVLFNDYDYCLVHLVDQYPQYKEHYVNARKHNRDVLLDNSIFELGHSFETEAFVEKVHELKPTFYIVPDVLEDAEGTQSNFRDWMSKYSYVPGVRIGVVQGKTWTELVYCYKFMSKHADYIAISFDYSYYETTGFGDNKLEQWCTGRQRFINQLISEGIWNHNKPHHLLGASLAKEFKAYHGIKSIRSCDTSNPIVAGLKGLRYNSDLGLNEKPSVKLADLIESKVTQEQVVDIHYNVTKFKEILGRYENL